MSMHIDSEYSPLINSGIAFGSEPLVVKDDSTSHLEVIKRVRELTGQSILGWAAYNNITRTMVYQSAEGRGSRKVRVILAALLGQQPSQLWPFRGDRVKKLDDDLYRLTVNKVFKDMEENAWSSIGNLERGRL